MNPPSNIRALFDNHAKIILDLLNAAEVQAEESFDEDDYRDAVQDELTRLQICIEELARTLSFEAFAVIQATELEILDVVRKIRHPGARDIAIDEITNHFSLSVTYYDQWMATDPAVKLKLAKQVIAQSHEPAEIARKYVSEVDKNKFLDSFMALTKELRQPGINADEWQLATFFSELRQYLEEQSRVEGAVEHFAAHLHVVGPLIQQLVTYGKSDSSDLKTKIVRNGLAVNCEFLAGLYAATNSNLIKELGAIATVNPSGLTPFAFLETMDLGLTPAWYNEMQGKADDKYLIALINHALVAPGVPLNLARLENNCDAWKVKGYLEGIKSAPVDQPECAGKVKQLLGALAEQCQTHTKGAEIRREIMKSDLPRSVLEPHLTLLGDRFTQELGV